MGGERHRVLLADEERDLVDALRLALHRYRSWSVDVATTSAEVLARLDGEPFDAVVTSAHLEVAGRPLLDELIARWPSMVRVVLGGESLSREEFDRVRARAHHVLPRPVSAAALFARLELSLTARAQLGDAQQAIGALSNLPSLPSTFATISRLSHRPDSTLEQFTQAVERDVAVCSNVLRLVNSAWFGLSKPVSSMREAVRLLGIRPLENVVLATEVFAHVGPDVNALQRRSLVRLAAAPRLVRALGVSALLDEACTALVLCDVGELIELLLERQRVAATGQHHALLGAAVLTMWGLPAVLCEAVALHHRPRAPSDASATLSCLVALVCRLQERAEAPPASRVDLAEQLAVLAGGFGVTTEVLDELGQHLT
jgi:HD-like signal output (HDOD) protein